MPAEIECPLPVEAWLVSSGFGGVVRDALERHRARDVDALRAKQPRPEANSDALASLASVMGDRPELLHAAPGCGGLHLDRADSELDQEAITAGNLMLSAEAAALNGRSFEADVRQVASVAFPIAGRVLRFEGPRDVRLRSHRGLVEATWLDGRALIEPQIGHGIARSISGNGSLAGDAVIVGIRILNAWPTLGSVMRGGLRVSVIDADFDGNTQLAATRGLRILARAHEALFDELVGAGTCLVPLATANNERESFSVRQLPGVVYTNFIDPFDVIDLTCHEYLHLKLFLLQENHVLMLRPETPVISPWRPDLRSVEGLYHACYVFFGAADLLDRVFKVWPANARGKARLLVWRTAIDASAELLAEAEPGLTTFGSALFSRIVDENRDRLRDLTRDRPDLAGWASEAVVDHVSQAGRPGSEAPWFLGI